MRLDPADNLSYYTKPGGFARPAMPDQDPSFSWSEIKDFVGELPELLPISPRGYAFVHNAQEAALQDQEENELATSLYAAESGDKQVLRGNVFVIHPRHLDQTMRATLSRQRQSESKL
jgi:hypothetical protein